MSGQQLQNTWGEPGQAIHTLVKVVLVLLALLAASRSRVELVTDAAEEATGARGRLLLARALLLGDLLVDALALAAAAGELVDKVHCDVCVWLLGDGRRKYSGCRGVKKGIVRGYW